jgi:hypothetical protein
MKKLLAIVFTLVCAMVFSSSSAFAQATGHASVGLGHGEEGYLHLQEMVKHLEFSLKMPDADENLKAHGAVALKHAKEALAHYDEAIKHASESLGRPARVPMAEGSGGGQGHDDGYGKEEGSH